MKKFMLNALLFMVIAAILPGVHLNGILACFIMSFVFACLNAILKPILMILTLPLNFLTLGLFTFVVNGIVLYAASGLVSNFSIDGLSSAILASILLSLGQAFFHEKEKKPSRGPEIYGRDGRRL
ncbi:phage holin family protein [Vaginisenegalia massiliensis]|uniref:phage holin family protein n=1 Tax=Vaginisenegalia massiliensis TaxID=2058294 RepID=UPI000F53C398|nr:phage holin family protein [Vaginisenegalia massiliensis]